MKRRQFLEATLSRVLLLCLGLAGGACLGQDAAELEVDHNVRATFTTPHTKWATPYALGKTRVLFFLRGHDTEPREVNVRGCLRLRCAVPAMGSATSFRPHA
jgi:hypothetical protein